MTRQLGPDHEYLIEAFKERLAPLDRDVVRTAQVAAWMAQHTRTRPSVDRVGRILAALGGVTRVIKVHGRSERVMVLRDRDWLAATAKDIITHMDGDIDICD